MTQNILSISQINEYIRSMMDSDGVLASVAVRGEISNYKLYPSGHHYFSLKDENSSIRCVMFRGNAMSLRFRPENNLTVIAFGRISVYPRDGAYQLYCTRILVDGVGDLYAALEQRKAKLAALGYFDPQHKKQIPKYPQTIGVVTSSAGAAVHDIIRILRKRYPLCKVRLFPVRVQGEEAAGEIASAIQYANIHKLADLLIVGRGGGSMEDLWAFNEEPVAQAIYHSQIPVISAVGHEPDVTIADYVADLRAATPSNGAELAVPDQDVLRQNLDACLRTMAGVLGRQIRSSRQNLKAISMSLSAHKPSSYLNQRRLTLKQYRERLFSGQRHIVSVKKQGFIGLTAKLDAMSPLKVLTRGYALVEDENGNLVRSSNQVKIGDTLHINVCDGSLQASVTKAGE